MADYSYIGIREDGVAVAIVIDDPRYKRDTAKTIVEWIRKGRTIERLEHHAAVSRLQNDMPRVRP